MNTVNDVIFIVFQLDLIFLCFMLQKSFSDLFSIINLKTVKGIFSW